MLPRVLGPCGIDAAHRNLKFRLITSQKNVFFFVLEFPGAKTKKFKSRPRWRRALCDFYFFVFAPGAKTKKLAGAEMFWPHLLRVVFCFQKVRRVTKCFFSFLEILQKRRKNVGPHEVGISTQHGTTARRRLWSQIWAQMWSQIWSQMWSQIWAKMWPQIFQNGDQDFFQMVP